MNFSSFVSPFSVSSAINNHQFPAKFIAADELNGVEANADANCNVDDGNFLRMNAESMMMAVSRYQNCGPRFNHQQNLLHKYYRENESPQENLATNSIGSTFTTGSSASPVSSVSLIASKFRANDGLPSTAYHGNVRAALQPAAKSETPAKRCGSGDQTRLHVLGSNVVVKREEKDVGDDADVDVPTMTALQTQPTPPSAAAGISVASWQSIAAVAAAVAGAPAPSASTTAVADYLSHLPPGSSLPISLHNLFKYSSAEGVSPKKEPDAVDGGGGGHASSPAQQADAAAVYFNGQTAASAAAAAKKKKRKKAPKEKKPKPKPGEIRVTTALDGSALFCCPECHMAYPDKGLLEQHLLGHTIERRFFCDICGAGLKRKDHLTRHKQSHNPDRPHACSVCSKAFKRKEQLALHYVIHSGEKRHVCPECGKGFYRKDHLRKHTRSHIARRVKAELSQYVPNGSSGNGHHNSVYSSAS